MKYRPWGPVEWTLSLSNPKQWHYIGAIGTEERSLCAWSYMRTLGAITSESFAQIHDADSEKYRERNRIALERRRNDLIGYGGSLNSISSFNLMDELFQITAFARKAENIKSSIVLDVTSLPKRFFFLILKLLVNNPDVHNLLVTYTTPECYADDAPLYEDIESWKNLPGFGGTGVNKPEHWVVSVGFLVESLRREIKDNPGHQVKVLIPFPAPLAVLKRTWKSIAELEEGYENHHRFEKFRVDTLDMSAAFDRICSLANNPPKNLAFAPFGPKPTAAAICLYALQRDDFSSVLYPQPTVYHPDYSKGIRNGTPATAVSAYWVKHEGEFLYEI
jgi:hypothetical protein